MKLPRLLVIAACALCAGCHSLDHPLAGLNPFRTGRDARTYNMQTGEFEWPANATPRPKTPAARAATAAPAPKGDGRYYDPQKAQFNDPAPGR